MNSSSDHCTKVSMFYDPSQLRIDWALDPLQSRDQLEKDQLHI